VVAPHDVDSSIAYLSRRLDENTSPENFLRSLFTLQPGTSEFAEQERRFRTSVAVRSEITMSSHRGEVGETQLASGFENASDSDFTVASVRDCVLSANSSPALSVPHTATVAEIDAVMDRANSAAQQWGMTSLRDRHDLLDVVAATMQAHRFDTLAIMAEETGKTVREGDPEVSEAIDFARYYGTAGTHLITELQDSGVAVSPRGVVVVVAPWNFPYAIAAGGVCAALAAGNAVVLKPAPEARRTAWALASHLWEAGVAPDLVQFVACDDNDVGQHLVTHADVETVVLTGSYDTAKLFVGWKPDIRLLAETSGKNALIITAAADIDAALRDLVRSAFGHAGQKCSAASLAIVEASVYDDPIFHQRLGDAVRSLRVGWPSEPATWMGPLINAPSGPLARALTVLDAGESWLVEPKPLTNDTNRLWSPGVKVGVRAGSWFHMTECFGPVLGIMRADDLNHAISLQNATPYGLTGGIHSLDPAEVREWLDRVEVGNAYVNRHITGAVVQRQPFGGWKRSSIGCGAKAGGPDYVLSLSKISATIAPNVIAANSSFPTWWQSWFAVQHDPSALQSERNVLRYRPLGPVVLRIGPDTRPESVSVARAAADCCGVTLTVSDASSESDQVLERFIVGAGVERVRSLTTSSDDLRLWLIAHDVGLDESVVSDHGRIELPRWLKEQAISETTHRYGRITTSVLDGPACPPRR
jgi:RHH-type proline utilization regulon transcriptional repressor/proline dehydrogenase/delta 1-pyrroline-5-carboxylate dehydrogenase